MVKIRFASGLCSLQYKAERLGWSGALLLQTEAALIGNYSREQLDYSMYFIWPHLKKTNYAFKIKDMSKTIFLIDSHYTKPDIWATSLNLILVVAPRIK